MAQILSASLTVVTDAGTYTVETTSPSPGGGNPRFVTAQLGTALGVLGARAERILTTEHGPQMVVLSPVTVEPSPVGDDAPCTCHLSTTAVVECPKHGFSA